MAKKTSDDTIVDVEEVYSKGEKYIEENKKSLTIIFAVLVAIVGIYFGYTKFYIGDKQSGAEENMWMAQRYFAQDSFNLALHGDGTNYGFIDILDEYSAAPGGNLANYYIGACYIHMGQFNEAIDYLNAYDGDDEMLAPMAAGLIGDAYIELDQANEGLSYYEKAANMSDNDFTAPYWLKKAGDLNTQLGNYEAAIDSYNRIKYDYPESELAQSIEKPLARAETLRSASNASEG